VDMVEVKRKKSSLIKINMDKFKKKS